MARAFVVGEQVGGTFYVGRLPGWGDVFVTASGAQLDDSAPWPETGEASTGLGERLCTIALPAKPRDPMSGNAWRKWGERCRKAIMDELARRP